MIVARAFGIFHLAKQYKVSIELVLFVQNIKRDIRLGAPFKLGALGCSLKALALIRHCIHQNKPPIICGFTTCK
jgi:hypothetical protein